MALEITKGVERDQPRLAFKWLLTCLFLKVTVRLKVSLVKTFSWQIDVIDLASS